MVGGVVALWKSERLGFRGVFWIERSCAVMVILILMLMRMMIRECCLGLIATVFALLLCMSVVRSDGLIALA